tara:strand:+ start:1118 stop:1768 length:651 start_codon:yes stop_codon:yes gene_type:complete
MSNNKANVTVIDYGTGNLLSLKRAFEHVGAKVNITNDHKLILNSSRVVLPGVGAYGKAMDALKDLNLTESIISVAKKEIPFLGICLGMQLLLSESEEFGFNKGLNLIEGKVKSIRNVIKKNNVKLPHIGWNTLKKIEKIKLDEKNLLYNYNEKDSFYFIHSFASFPKNLNHRLFDTVYESIDLPAIIGYKNIYGFQFHPEKSGKTGLKLLEKFLKI